MGYFRRKLRRARCAAAKREAVSGPALDVSGLLPDAPRTVVPGGQRFLRLVTDEIHPDSRMPAGVFAAAYWLRDSTRITAEERARLRQLLRWFETNLPVPRGEIPSAAIFWYRADARRCVHQMWGIVRMLRASGRVVRVETTKTPGRIVYRDAFQIAALARSSTFAAMYPQ